MIHQMISFSSSKFFSAPHVRRMSPPTRIAAYNQYSVNDLSSKRHVPCTSSSICTKCRLSISIRLFYRTRLLLAERIGVAIQQLHHGSILGLQTPYFGAELYNCKLIAVSPSPHHEGNLIELQNGNEQHHAQKERNIQNHSRNSSDPVGHS